MNSTEERLGFDEKATREAAEDFRSRGVEAVAIVSVFSPVTAIHEERAAKIFSEVMSSLVPITLSHEIGSIGLLERENASALNAALMRVAQKAIIGFVEAVKASGLASVRSIRPKTTARSCRSTMHESTLSRRSPPVRQTA